jgi:uncharacterized protein YbjT (DUF2867 family)
MRIAVAGGTGLVGRQVVEALGRAGHEPVVLARSQGVDVLTGDGLDEALQGVDAVIDVSNFDVWDAEKARETFATATDRLLAAAHAAEVGHHVVLSIVGVDRVEGNAHYAGKRAQEQHALAGPVPVTILRATQFHDFAEMVADWTREGSVSTVPPLLVQPVAVSDVSAALVDIAAGPPQTRATDLAGPEPQDLVDMARRTLHARGRDRKLVASWRGTPFGVEMAGEVLLPEPDARRASTTFDEWLASITRTPE